MIMTINGNDYDNNYDEHYRGCPKNWQFFTDAEKIEELRILKNLSCHHAKRMKRFETQI